MGQLVSLQWDCHEDEMESCSCMYIADEVLIEGPSLPVLSFSVTGWASARVLTSLLER